MPGGNKEHQPLALNQFDNDVHLRVSSQHDKLFEHPYQRILYFGRFWVDTFNELTKLNQCGDSGVTEKINTLSYDNSYPRKIRFFNGKVNHLLGDFNQMKEILVCLPMVCTLFDFWTGISFVSMQLTSRVSSVQLAAFNGPHAWEKHEKLGPWTEPHFELPSLVHYRTYKIVIFDIPTRGLVSGGAYITCHIAFCILYTLLYY